MVFGTTNTTTINSPVPASSITLNLPSIADTLVGRATTDTLTNKTLTGTTNVIRATQLATTGSDVVISAAAPGTTGQVLTLSSATTAIWQTLSGGLPATNQYVYVQNGGSDTTGNGSINLPYATITQAIASITTATPTNRFSIMVGPGTYTANLSLKTNVFIVGTGVQTTRITGNLDIVDTSWNNVGNDDRSGIIGVNISGTTTINFVTNPSPAGKFYIYNSAVGGLLSMTAYAAINQVFTNNTLLYASFTQTGCQHLFVNSVDLVGGATVNSSANCATILYSFNSTFAGTLTGTYTSTNAVTMDLYNTGVSGTLTLSGSALTCNATSEAVSLAPVISGGATLNRLSDVVSLTATQTLTNKTLVAPNIGAATGTSLTSTGTSLVLSQTGDTYGATSLSLENRTGMNGALFSQSGSVNLVDFGFYTPLGITNLLRTEQRTGSLVSGSNSAYGEFQFIFNSTGGQVIGAAFGSSVITMNVPVTANTIQATSLSTSGQLTSTIATGTAPLVVTSTTQVSNLTATNSYNIGTFASSNNASYYPLFVASSTNGYQPACMDANFTYNPSTNLLTMGGLALGTTNLLTIASTQTTSQTLSVPNLTGADTLVTLAFTQTLTNKTLTAPVISSIYNGGTLTMPTGTDTIVGRATTDTLSNKTLSLPIIAQISNTGTLTLPTSTDTLVGRATTDTLTNKTLTNPIINQIINTGTLTLPTSTDTLIGRSTTDLLTNKSFQLSSNTYTTGTVSQSTTVVTGVSTVWTNAMIGGLLVYANGVQAFITGFTSATSLTVSQSQTVTSQAYTIYYGGQQEDNSGNMCTAKQFYSQASNTYHYDGTTPTKKLTFALSAATAATTLTLNGQQSTSQTLNFPNITATDTLVVTTLAQTLTNKTLTGTTNTIRATQLGTTGSDVNVSSSAAGVAGNALILTSATTATWQSVPTLISVTVVTTGTTFTTASNAGHIRAFVVGGGGGGGGSASSSGGGASGGGGGGGGVCDTGLIAVSASTAYTIAIGAAGGGGASGYNAGTSGGNTTLVVGATTYTGGGGGGGNGGTNTTTTTGSSGGAGGTATNGILQISGVPGGFAFAQNTVYVISGAGGYAPGYGSPPSGVSPTTGGTSGSGWGAGGSGGASVNSASAAGGAGTHGAIVIEQYV